MFVLCKDGRKTTDPNMLCRTSDRQLCVWISEDAAIDYASKRKFDNWRAREATSEDFALIGSTKANRFNTYRPCYVVIDRGEQMNKKSISSGSLVELFENYEARKFAISSKAEHEKEFINEVSQVLSTTPTQDWGTRLKEVLPLIVDMCCKYRGYKAETVFERRELVAGDLEMPRSA
jgi:hypothetical protein